MTNSLKILLLAIAMLFGTASAQSKFLGICENPAPEIIHEMRWLKHFFKVKTCEDVAGKISKLRSYNEFFLPRIAQFPRMQHSWMKAMPYLNGIKETHSVMSVMVRDVGPGLNVSNLFKRPEVYSEFTNLKVIDLSFGRFNQIGECNVLKMLPHIEIAMVDSVNLKSLEGCRPYSDLPDLIVVGDAIITESLEPAFKMKIIGIELLINFQRTLQKMPRLRYLGLSYPFTDYQYQSLIRNQNITHLSINSKESLENAVVLGELQNLSFLALSCITNQRDRLNLTPGFAPPATEYCKNAGLKNVNFLKDLPFLENIILDFEGLEDLSVLDSMPQLKLKTHPFI